MIRRVMNGMDGLLIRNRKHYLVKNSLSLNKKEILNWYKKHSVIEEFFKSNQVEIQSKMLSRSFNKDLGEPLIFRIILFLLIRIEKNRFKYNNL